MLNLASNFEERLSVQSQHNVEIVDRIILNEATAQQLTARTERYFDGVSEEMIGANTKFSSSLAQLGYNGQRIEQLMELASKHETEIIKQNYERRISDGLV